MPSNIEVLDVFCDESGNTGAKLLDPDQRFFSYASVAISDEEAFEIIKDARSKYSVQMPELKARLLLKTKNGKAIVNYILERIEGRYSFVVYDKLLALCGKVFEYIYEPVFQHDPRLLYEKNLHRFVAMFCFIFFNGDTFAANPEGESDLVIREFENYMRSLDRTKAPTLFDQKFAGALSDKDPFSMILDFADGYRELIVADNANIKETTPDQGKWTLDVAVSGLFSLCNHWGKTGQPLGIICDDSKPLEAMVHLFDEDSMDGIIQHARMVAGKKQPLGWKLATPIEFANSRDHPGLQIADVIAGAATTIPAVDIVDDLKPIAESLQVHAHQDCILPDFERVDFQKNREAAVNYLILYHLSQKAKAGENPFEGLEEMYRTAEVMWVNGEVDQFLNRD